MPEKASSWPYTASRARIRMKMALAVKPSLNRGSGPFLRLRLLIGSTGCRRCDDFHDFHGFPGSHEWSSRDAYATYAFFGLLAVLWQQYQPLIARAHA